MDGLKESVDRDIAGSGPGTGLMEKVVEFYHKAMYRAVGGLKHLKRYALDDTHLIDSYRIGHCDGSLLGLIAEDRKRADLVQMGLIRETDTGLVETFKGCVVFPVMDADGGLAGLSGVEIKTGHWRQMSGTPGAIWNMQAARNYPEILLTDGIIDALSLIRAGYPNTVGLLRLDIEKRDVELLQSLGVTRVSFLVSSGHKSDLKEAFSCIEYVPISIPGRSGINALLVKHGTEGLASRVDGFIAGAEIIKPAAVSQEKRAEVLHNGLLLVSGPRRYMVRGIEKTQRHLRVTVRVEHRGRLHVDTVDLYSAKARRNLAQDLARLFEESADTIASDMTRLIRQVEAFDPDKVRNEEAEVKLSPEERRQAEKFGKAHDIIERILSDYERCGLIGEQSNKLLSYIAAVSRKLADPLSILVLSSSGAGKTALQDATLALCPPEDVIKLTSLTGKALFYKGRESLKHKILAIEEGAGAEDATYAIRNLVSAKELVIEATVKDFATGKMTTMENRVEGPTAVFFTTTDPDPDPETRSRFFVLTVDESREQTRAILAYQKKKHMPSNLAGRDELEEIMNLHRNFQRILKPLTVVNPHAEKLEYGDDRLQSRRDQPKYLNLINAVAFLRQMGKEVLTAEVRGKDVEYIEVDEKDLAIAGELFEQISQRSLDDLNGVSRALLQQIESLVNGRIEQIRSRQERNIPNRQDIVFSRRDIREYTGWSHNRVTRYIKQLVECEFVAVESGRFGAAYRYRLLSWDNENLPDLTAPARYLTGREREAN